MKKIEKTRIRVLSKPNFNGLMEAYSFNDETVEKDEHYAFISINDTVGDWKTSWFSKNHDNVLRMWFDDVSYDDEVSPTNKESCKAFTEKDGKKIIKFVNKNKDRDFIIHCAAGISRSGAIGTFILDYLNGDQEFFYNENKNIIPSAHVSIILNRLIWEERFKNLK